MLRFFFMADVIRMKTSEILMNIHPFSSINYPCSTALYWTREQLTQAGLRSVQTFDLHAVRAGLHDCLCPNHGTDACDCQMVILLIYGESEEPVTLTLHGNDGQTSFTITEAIVNETTTTLVDFIKTTLGGKHIIDASLIS